MGLSALEVAVRQETGVIGIIGTGINNVYPPENKKLFAKVEQNGAIVSEFPPNAPPNKYHFPWRNRLISGWGMGVLVVEAGLKSGTLITVRWGLEQGKDRKSDN